MSLQRTFWIVFTATTAVYLTMILWSLPVISNEAEGLVPFDLRPGGYTLDQAGAFLSTLSEAGRTHYLRTQHVLDLFYPGLMALSLVLAYLLLFSRRWAVWVSFVAILAAVFDWSENAKVANMLKVGSEGLSQELVAEASLMTLLKSAATTMAMVVLFTGLAMALWRRMKEKGV